MTLPSPGDPASVVNQLQESIEFSADPIQNQEALSLMYKRTANAVNTKSGGLYSLTEQINFEQFSIDQPTNATQTFAQVYRKTFNLVALNGGNIGASATVTFPHGIKGIVRATLIYCSCASTTPQYFTVVYPNAYMTATNVVFVNPTATPLTSCIFVAEITKT